MENSEKHVLNIGKDEINQKLSGNKNGNISDLKTKKIRRGLYLRPYNPERELKLELDEVKDQLYDLKIQLNNFLTIDKSQELTAEQKKAVRDKIEVYSKEDIEKSIKNISFNPLTNENQGSSSEGENNQRSRQAEENNPAPSETSQKNNTASEKIVIYRQPGNSWTSIGGGSLFFHPESPKYNDYFVGPDDPKGMEKVYYIDHNGLGEPIIAPEDGTLEVSAILYTAVNPRIPIIYHLEITVGTDVVRKIIMNLSPKHTHFQEGGISVKKNQEIRLRSSKIESSADGAVSYPYTMVNLIFTLVKSE